MALTLRRATTADKPRILEIAAQIWEGNDYVPHVIDEWLASEQDEVTVALSDDKIIAFARFAWILPHYAWFEGIRTDPEYRGGGAGKAITRYFLEKAHREGASRAGLSTYIENLASIHIIESHGFSKVSTFVMMEAGEHKPRNQGIANPDVEEISPDEVLDYVAHSDFLKASHGYLPRGWWFYPYDEGAREFTDHLHHALGLRNPATGNLRGLLCIGRSTHGPHEFYIDFLEGDPEALRILLNHGFYLGREATWFSLLIPRWDTEPPLPALQIAQELGLEPWQEFTPDVWVYEQPITSQENIP